MSHRVLIEGSPQLGATTPAQTTVNATAGLLLAANPLRKGFIVQNTGTTVIKLTLGATAPTQTVYQIALKGCTAGDDATGSIYSDDAWVGDVRAISSVDAGTCVVTEFKTGSPDWNRAFAYSS